MGFNNTVLKQKNHTISLLSLKCSGFKKKYLKLKNDISKKCTSCKKTKGRYDKRNMSWLSLAKHFLKTKRQTEISLKTQETKRSEIVHPLVTATQSSDKDKNYSEVSNR